MKVYKERGSCEVITMDSPRPNTYNFIERTEIRGYVHMYPVLNM